MTCDAPLAAHVELLEGTEPEGARGALIRMLDECFPVRHVTLQLDQGPCCETGHLHP